MTDRELMQQALDALEQYVGVVISVNDPNDWTPKVADAGEPARKAIEALRERLAQPEQDPVATVYDAYDTTGIDWHCKDAPATGTKLYTAPPQPKTKQEPVVWTERELELIDGMIEAQVIHAERCDSIPNRAMAEKQKGWDMERIELLRKIRNTAPPQREWQGLTTQEIADETDIATSSNKDIFDLRKAFWCGARWADEKLKEKNT